MKNVFFIMRSLVIMMIVTSCVSRYFERKSVGYTYKPLAAEGCSMSYSVLKQDSVYYIIATVSSDRMKFLREPTMLIKTFDNEIVLLKGELFDTDADVVNVGTGDVMIPASVVRSTAQFKVTSCQFEQIKKGIAKIRLSTIPIEHEREFRKDVLGKNLYELYLHEVDKDIQF